MTTKQFFKSNFFLKSVLVPFVACLTINANAQQPQTTTTTSKGADGSTTTTTIRPAQGRQIVSNDKEVSNTRKECVFNTDPLNPDTDGDGLTDPEEVRMYKTNPRKVDTDGEGLPDGDEVKKYKTDPTKPDTDGDGLTDAEELSITKTNPLNPDTDGDGIVDGQDKCPLVKGVKEKQGCPATPTPPPAGKFKKKLDFQNVFFYKNTDKFNLEMNETEAELRKMKEYLDQCPEIRVVVEGHASREGNEKNNQRLSDIRAKATKKWLIDNGVAAEKIVGTKGYGSRVNAVTEPAPNSKDAKAMNPDELEALRKKNRRITVAVQTDCPDFIKTNN